MDSFLNNFFSHIPFYFEALLSVIAALYFLVFLRGFLAGSGHVFDDSAHIEHQQEANERTVWGAFGLLFMFVVWEIFRLVASLFGYGTLSPATAPTTIIMGIILVLFLLIFRPKKH